MSLPVGLSTVTVSFGPYIDYTGVPFTGRLLFSPSARVTWGGAVLVDSPISVTLDGSASVVLGPSATSSGFSDCVVIGNGASTPAGSGAGMVAIGKNAKSNTACVSIGASSSAWGSISSVAIGDTATADGGNGVAVGASAAANASGAVAIGKSTAASGGQAVAIGLSAAASGQYAIAIGNGSGASNGGAISIGYNASNNGGSGVVIGSSAASNNGNGNTVIGPGANVSAAWSAVALGDSANANKDGAIAGPKAVANRCCQFSHATTIPFASNGDSQASRIPCKILTTDATPAAMTAGGYPTNWVTLGTTRTLSGVISIAAHRTDVTGTAAAWPAITFAITRDSSGNVRLLGTPTGTGTTTFRDAGAATWTVAVTANTANQCLDITVTGEAGKTIRWVALVDFAEVG